MLQALHNTTYAQRSRKFIRTCEVLKLTQVTCRCQVKSSRRLSTWGHFQTGHVSVPQRLADLIISLQLEKSTQN